MTKTTSTSTTSRQYRKSDRWRERIAKGFANHLRIQILRLLKKEPELSLGEICDRFEMDITNGSEHVRKLTIARLVVKRRQHRHVLHRITNRGIKALSFLDTLE